MAAVIPELLELLACPVPECRGKLTLVDAVNPCASPGGVADGSDMTPAGTADEPDPTPGGRGAAAAQRLLCGGCGRRYPVEENWPVLIPEEAELPARPTVSPGRPTETPSRRDEPRRTGT